ncbi:MULTISPECIES: hypothetical protein [Arenibacter]|uniref:hypothetical protein n=1 Tax=Arenibacter TaxID=178469 RepID=UPI0004DF6402|nr:MULTISPECIES: hypothetical protein [Arenibacter]GBF22569.1 hypothetical protein C21_04769 [Arenibacter sp. NBRC 103722]
MKTQKENILENYLYDINLADELFITLNIDKINTNGDNFRQYTVDAMDIEHTIFCIAFYHIGKNTILTILEGEETLYHPEYELKINSQFLITKNELSENLEIRDLAKYVNPEVADLVFGYFD